MRHLLGTQARPASAVKYDFSDATVLAEHQDVGMQVGDSPKGVGVEIFAQLLPRLALQDVHAPKAFFRLGVFHLDEVMGRTVRLEGGLKRLSSTAFGIFRTKSSLSLL